MTKTEFGEKFYYLYGLWKGVKTSTVSVLLITFVILFLYFIPRTFLINLRVQHNSGASLYYNVGSFVYQKDNQFDEYLTRRKEYTTDYITSLYEPSIKVGEQIYTIYRPMSQPIKFRDQTYYFFVGETTAYLAPKPELLPVYETNMIVGPSIGLFGYGNSIYHYSWQELYKAHFENRVDVDVNCYDFVESNCGDKFEKLNIDAVTIDEKDDAFLFSYNYHLGPGLIGRNVQPMSAYVIPEDFYLCPTLEFDEFDCFYPKEKEKVDWEDMPLRVLNEEDDSYELLTLRDLDLVQFYITNLKIPDQYTIKVSDPYQISDRRDYYFVHKGNELALRLTPKGALNPRADIQLQFGTIRFYDDICNDEVCSIDIEMQFISK